MRILLINKYFYLKGGTERYVFILSQLLKKHGHQVAIFAMNHPNNAPTKWSKYFVSYVNLKKPSQTGRLKSLSRLFYSHEAQHQIEKLIQDFKPDIAHIHNIYGHISPSILATLKKHHIPIIQTVHDYHLIHPNPNMFHDGKPCQITQFSPLLPLFHRCLHPNFLYSFVPSLAFAMHRITKAYSKNIDIFIAPSLFMKNKLIEFGFPASKITHLPNPITPPVNHKHHTGKYVLFFGQLVEHKGVLTLLNAARQSPQIPFVLAGKGPLKSSILSQNLPNLTFKEQLAGNQLANLITNARFVIHPAIWYENQPYSIMESLSYGKPVIATKIGGIPEIIKQHHNGLLIKPGDNHNLIKSIKRLWTDHKLRTKLAKNALQTAKTFMAQDAHYQSLMRIYQQATVST